MRADYEKPSIEIEEYELNTSIASGCDVIVDLGPGDETHEICEDYAGAFGWNAEVYEQPFYTKESCSCYLSAGGGTLSTS